MVGYFILATSVVAAVYGAVWYGRWLAKIGPPNWYRRRLTAKRGESHMIDIRRGMTRLGVVLLVLWELPLFYFWATDQPALTWTRSEEHTSELQSHSDLVC